MEAISAYDLQLASRIESQFQGQVKMKSFIGAVAVLLFVVPSSVTGVGHAQDVTEIGGAALDDEVVLIGEQGGEKITAADIAHLTWTIAYEVLCGIAARVPRTMVD